MLRVPITSYPDFLFLEPITLDRLGAQRPFVVAFSLSRKVNTQMPCNEYRSSSPQVLSKKCATPSHCCIIASQYSVHISICSRIVRLCINMVIYGATTLRKDVCSPQPTSIKPLVGTVSHAAPWYTCLALFESLSPTRPVFSSPYVPA